MTRGFVIIGGVILVAGAGNALAMSASFWAGTALFGHLARLHDRRRAESTASLRFAMRRYNESNCAHGGSTVPYAARVQGACKEAHRTMNRLIR